MRTALVVVLVLLLSSGVLRTAGALVPPPPNLPVSTITPPTYAYQSPSLALDPVRAGHVAASYYNGNSWTTCYVALSTDAGHTWAQSALVGVGGRFGFPPGKVACRDETLAFGPDGRLYVAYKVQAQGDNNSPSLYITSSVDGGVTFQPPHLIDAGDGVDYLPTLATDAAGRVYVSFTRYCPPNLCVLGEGTEQAVIAVSEDKGTTFTAPAAVSTVSQPFELLSSVAVDGFGNAYVAFLDWTQWYATNQNADLTLNVASSTDGGRTLGAPSPVTQVWRGCAACDYTYYFPSDSFAQVAAGPAAGQVFAVTRIKLGSQSASATGPGSGLRIAFSASSDSGRTWTTATVVGVPLGQAGDDQYLPHLSVAPNGRIDIAYYDAHANGTQDVFWTSSNDGGKSFAATQPLTAVASDMRIGPPGFTKASAQFGSHLGAVSTDAGLLVAWTDTRRGTTDNGHQDVYMAQVDLSGSSTTGRPTAPRPSPATLRANSDDSRPGLPVLIFLALVVAYRHRQRRGSVHTMACDGSIRD